jgi:hypothetical protein
MSVARPLAARRVSRLSLLLSSGVSLLLHLQPASAVDWRLDYRLGDTVRASDNIRQIIDPLGPGASNDATAGLDLIMRDKTLTWSFSGDIGYERYFGEEIPDPSSTESRSLKSDLEKKTRDTDYTLNAFYSSAPATISEFTDLGIVVTGIDRLNYGAGGGFVHRINKRDSLNFSIDNSWTDYSETSPNLTPNRSLSASLRWVRQLNARVSGNMLTSIIWYKADDPLSDREYLIYTNSVGTEARLTRRLTVSANAGATLIDNYAIDQQAGLGRQRTMVYGFIGDFLLEYKPFSDTTFTINLSQDVSIDDLGDLRASQRANFGLNYVINDFSSLNLSGGLSKSTGGEDDPNPPREIWRASAVYSHAINSRWNASIGYRWVQSQLFDLLGADEATSNTIFVSLNTNGTLVP